MKIDGQCHCGAVRYEAVIDPEDVGICHCTDCQQLTGSVYRVTAIAARRNFRISSGEPKTYVKTGANGRIRYQMFCGDCGSPLYTTGTDADAEEIGIRWGNIRQRAALLPKSQIWCSSAANWFAEVQKLPGRNQD
ncbi:GFA family protein [Pararhizobium gei]|uniref:GFA family protein n=1 Tax=Pararhizobium gei TaxID=1395951 RepID=UPI0023DC130D|nr:GFA family protein [Rhizobium gei]